MIAVAFVVLAGAGTLGRWQASRLNRPGWATGTFAVNLAAAFALGLAHDQSGDTRLLLGVAFLGSLSTFSTVVRETVAAVETHGPGRALAYATTTVVAGTVAALVGMTLS